MRKNVGGQMVLDTYGRSTGFCIDPIEKKPLSHFLPGTPVLSFGTAGCNLGCKFCQNWDISKSREIARLSDAAGPDEIAAAAERTGCRSVAFTYNDPVIWAEYAIDTAAACRAMGLHPVAVTAGYITPEARPEFYAAMDAANIDLKAFTENFYYKLTGAHIDPVLDTIRYACNETDCWVELTNLIIPQANDSTDELQRMCDWVLENVGDGVPVHFTAFHPDFRLRDRPATPHETLIQAYEIAQASGLRHPYVGNVHDVERQSTYCPSCRQLLIERDWHRLGIYAMRGSNCGHCGEKIAGRFEDRPGDWGARRQPVRITRLPEAAGRGAAVEKTKISLPVITAPPEAPPAPDQQRLQLHSLACRLVASAVAGHPAPDVRRELGELADRAVAGVFVTLKRGSTLRGCIGHQSEGVALAEALLQSAIRTATSDPRMPPVSAVELNYLTLSVTILQPPRVLAERGDDRLNAIEIGRHGLRIRMADRSGLLLPSVAVEQQWNARQFLDAVCRKAGLPAAAWRSDDAVVEIFEGDSVSAEFSLGDAILPAAETDHILSADDVAQLTGWVGQNLLCLRTGATPQYYAPQVADETVAGLVLNIESAALAQPLQLLNVSLRSGMPLQSTLFQMTQQAAAGLPGSGDFTVHLAVLEAPVHHGAGRSADVRGIDATRRAVLASDGGRTAFAWNFSGAVEELLADAIAAEAFREDCQIYSLRCQASSEKMNVSLRPQSQRGPTVRPAAVAGMFYPSDDRDRDALVDSFLQSLPPAEKQPVAAAMVPHAGLRYSGQIAADVWRRIELPGSVLIIGPKHTRAGVDWAVTPHQRWSLSSAVEFQADPLLARTIAESIDRMELDAAAHEHEHGIEVQLPLLRPIAPEIKVTGIAMGPATLTELKRAAVQLAGVLRSMSDPPLLVISSDMNHFADEDENRRRDALALAEMEKGDPEGLLRVCAAENVSMCGQIPAALVMLTLQELGRPLRYQQIGYGTSGDVSGDTSRVVGYAGVLFC